ncbi:MAG: hypothetical protein ACE5DN_05410, partial [Flavobacteriales bacterium]
MKKVLLYLLFALILLGLAFHFSILHIKSSAEWKAAERYIRQDARASSGIGAVQGFGYYASEDEVVENGLSRCVIQMTTIGEKGEKKL